MNRVERAAVEAWRAYTKFIAAQHVAFEQRQRESHIDWLRSQSERAPVHCGHCGTVNAPRSLSCGKCGATERLSLIPPPVDPPGSGRLEAEPVPRRRSDMIGVAAAFGILAVAVGILAMGEFALFHDTQHIRSDSASTATRTTVSIRPTMTATQPPTTIRTPLLARPAVPDDTVRPTSAASRNTGIAGQWQDGGDFITITMTKQGSYVYHVWAGFCADIGSGAELTGDDSGAGGTVSFCSNGDSLTVSVSLEGAGLKWVGGRYGATKHFIRVG
ncbi:hypothetical protein [Nocardia sp. alder85J]|uniref:hypothetical protein n=1 Tax=Nocardia sp. alder85J TaxID=2862949 RepID=UPI001CD66CA7|nr:hypothetical protein [Nocardia sp. alder85J]MCX4092546.1 hypothetical protein [Nocardia sp. alder85J]